MDVVFPLHRFQEHGAMTAAERDFLANICEPALRVERDRLIRGEGVASTEFYLLAGGWAASTRITPDGRRQIFKIHLPGDVLGTASMCSPTTVEQLFAIADVTIIPISLSKFAKVFEEHPRVAAKFLLSVQAERLALMNQLTWIGRSTAEMSVAAFLSDLLERLRPLGLVQNNSFTMVPKQEHIADLLGLTTVHTNRTLRSLGERGLISRSVHRYTIPDPAALARFAGTMKRQPVTDPSWLPSAR